MSTDGWEPTTDTPGRTPDAATDEPVSVAVVDAVTTATETPLEELPPLTEAVNPDALNELFSGCRTDGRVTFWYAGHSVTVAADRTITVD